MFRRLSSSLPKDLVFPTDLKGLGYYLNEKDQIRSIEHPDQEFNYFISKNERVCEVQREAMSEAIRNILKTRFLAKLNLTRLPLTANETDPHVPIYTSRNLSTANRTILYFGEDVQDIGVFALRTIGQVSVASGSALDFVSAIESSSNPPGLIIANMGQLLWYRRGGYPVTRVTWGSLPRKTGISLPMVVDPAKNRILGNDNMAAHVKYIFEQVVPQMVNPTAGLDIIGVGEGGTEVVEYLQSAWGKWKERVQALAVGSGYHWPATQFKDSDFIDFWGKRARAYLLSAEPVDTLLSGREDFGCNCYSSGEESFTERIMVEAHRSILSYFRLVADVPGYQEVPFDIPREKNEGSVEGTTNGGWD